MLLKSLEIENFRQFLGKQRIDFATDPDRNVTLIHGENGTGKTTLLNAILWCFFDDFTANFQRPDEILCKGVRNARTNDCKVAVSFEHDDKTYLASRHLVPGSRTTRFKLFRLDRGNHTEVPNATSLINSILPKDMSRYFFFHGEGISSISDLKGGEKFRRAIRDILGFTFAESAISDLQQIKLVYAKRVAELLREDEALRDTAQQKAAAEEELLRLRQQLEALTSLVQSLDEEKRRLDDRFANSKNADAKMLKTEINRISRVEDDLLRQHREASAERQGLVARYGWSAFGVGLAKLGLDFIDEATMTGRIPSPFQETFVADLLGSGQCVCGRPLHEGSLERARIAALIETATTAAISQRLMRARSAAANIKGRAQEFLDELKKIESRRKHLDDKIGEEEIRRTELEGRLSGIDEAEIKAMVEQLSALTRRVAAAHEERGRCAARIDDQNQILDRCKRELLRGGPGSAQANKLNAFQAVLDSMIKRCQSRLEDLEKNAKKSIALSVNKMLKEFSRKDYSIRVDSTFEFHLVTEAGEIVARSNGENLLLNLSFVSALIEMARNREKASGEFLVQGTVAPFVIDAPFGELDEQYKAVTVEFLPRTAKQLVLLLSSSHWKGTVDEALRDRIGSEYILVSHQKVEQGSKPDDKIKIGKRMYAQSIYGQANDCTQIVEVA